jgi:hypothetical protein
MEQDAAQDAVSTPSNYVPTDSDESEEESERYGGRVVLYDEHERNFRLQVEVVRAKDLVHPLHPPHQPMQHSTQRPAPYVVLSHASADGSGGMERRRTNGAWQTPLAPVWGERFELTIDPTKVGKAHDHMHKHTHDHMHKHTHKHTHTHTHKHTHMHTHFNLMPIAVLQIKTEVLAHTLRGSTQ